MHKNWKCPVIFENGKRKLCEIYGKGSIWSAKEKIQNTIISELIIWFLAYFFYQSVLLSMLFSPLLFVVLNLRYAKCIEQSRNILRSQFRDAILGIAANLKAGYAVENAFRECYQEVRLLYDREAPICKGIYRILQGLENNIPIEKLMDEFAAQTGVADIREFADVFRIAKKSGGNLSDIIFNTATTIGDKIEVDKEIEVLIASKKFELNIMNVIPFAIVLYIGVTSKGYFDVMYHTLGGRAVMTVCLIVYVAAIYIGGKITDIKV